MSFDVDTSPTEPGHSWFCNACEFQCFPFEAAREHVELHAVGHLTGSKFPHFVYERDCEPRNGVIPKGARRRIVAHGGEILAQIRRRRAA